MSAELTVVRSTFDVTDPWRVPSGATWTTLVRAMDGQPPRLRTEVAALWDHEAITFHFRAEDDGIVATHTLHDAPLYEEDVVEVFIAPRESAQYFEIEVNPLGATFDARIVSPDGVRATMRAEVEWTCEGLFAAVSSRSGGDTGDASEWRTVIRMPFASLEADLPEPGDGWRGNLFRIDRSESGDEYSAWRPTMKSPADFHVAAAFGTLRFK
jgi:hypothetical protein